jgi:hypothetical protein
MGVEGALVTNKQRVLVASEAIGADTERPVYAPGASWPADFRGARVGSVIVAITAITAGDSVVVTMQDSDDGLTWDTWFAFASLTAIGRTIRDMGFDGTNYIRSPRRFIRASINVTVAGVQTITLSVTVNYNQEGPRGEYASGVSDRAN